MTRVERCRRDRLRGPFPAGQLRWPDEVLIRHRHGVLGASRPILASVSARFRGVSFVYRQRFLFRLDACAMGSLELLPSISRNVHLCTLVFRQFCHPCDIDRASCVSIARVGAASRKLQRSLAALHLRKHSTMSPKNDMERIELAVQDGFVQLLLPDGEGTTTRRVPQNVVLKSTVLRQAIKTVDGDEVVPILLPKGLLMTWLLCIDALDESAARSRDSLATEPRILEFVQVRHYVHPLADCPFVVGVDAIAAACDAVVGRAHFLSH